jgi:CMP-N-acetylneuraminic acid synthetase
MARSGLTILAVVPARGGSKSIPRKNLAEIEGRSLVGHAAALCAGLPWIDHAVLSTDDAEIGEERSEERRVGKECRRLCRSRWSPYH